jgi:thiamine-phosphate pyrophosphorylase
VADQTDRCRLTLVVDHVAGAAADVEAALGRAACACVILVGAEGPDDVVAIVRMAQARGVAALIAGDPALAADANADGAHAADAPSYRAARASLGSGALIGADAGASRHEAMTLAEERADYVAFSIEDRDALIERVAWWAELFTTPCVAFAGDDADLALGLAEAGADFVAVGPAIWRDGEALAKLDAALAGLEEAA